MQIPERKPKQKPEDRWDPLQAAYAHADGTMPKGLYTKIYKKQNSTTKGRMTNILKAAQEAKK